MLMGMLRALAWVNSVLLGIGRNLAWAALALMVLVILLQVVARYVFNNALAWPDEAARFLMLWMTGLIAPSAFRWGGFVSINMFSEALPRIVGLGVSLVLLMLAFVVLVVGLGQSYTHTAGFGGNFDSSSLRVPLWLIGLEGFKMKLRYMYASLLVGNTLLLMVNVELILRAVFALFWPKRALPDVGAPNDNWRAS